MDPACPTKSRVQFGCTRFQKVNAKVHAYVRSKDEYMADALRLLRAFVDDAIKCESAARSIMEDMARLQTLSLTTSTLHMATQRWH